MPPRSDLGDSCSLPPLHDSLLETASHELEGMRLHEDGLLRMPPACFNLIKSLPGNHVCVDCGSTDPDWAAISYGALVCLRCSGRHRSLGVQTSCVRSLSMDHWSHAQVLSMLEGGNSQLYGFFERHALIHDNGNLGSLLSRGVQSRYKTKAARFYREQMSVHVCQVLEAGVYQGREASRKLHRKSSSSSLSESSSSSS